MARRLFCEISPFTYTLSVEKECWKRRLGDALRRTNFCRTLSPERLPVLVSRHESLILRRLGNVDMALQQGKAHNLALAAPRVSGICLGPHETFSFWRLVGPCTAARGYREGLMITGGTPGTGVGGGMCQFTNLLHWLALHSPLDITEHHHHNGLDLFPDHNRQVPFGCGTSIFYNYKDYRLTNNTANTFQFIVWLDETHLQGELRARQPLAEQYRVEERDRCFVREKDGYYRCNSLWRVVKDGATGNTLEEKCIMRCHARVMYDAAFIDPLLIR